MRKIFLTAGLAMLMTLTSGCELFHVLGLPFGNKVPFNPKAEVTDSSVQHDVQFHDVPVPLGFLLRRGEFFSYRCESFRMGKFRYDGAWTYRKAYAFYMNQMKLSGWNKVKEDDGIGTNFTEWTKGADRTRLFIDTLGKEVKITVWVNTDENGKYLESEA